MPGESGPMRGLKPRRSGGCVAAEYISGVRAHGAPVLQRLRVVLNAFTKSTD
jgi:hypothetical protein